MVKARGVVRTLRTLRRIWTRHGLATRRRDMRRIKTNQKTNIGIKLALGLFGDVYRLLMGRARATISFDCFDCKYKNSEISTFVFGSLYVVHEKTKRNIVLTTSLIISRPRKYTHWGSSVPVGLRQPPPQAVARSTRATGGAAAQTHTGAPDGRNNKKKQGKNHKAKTRRCTSCDGGTARARKENK